MDSHISYDHSGIRISSARYVEQQTRQLARDGSREVHYPYDSQQSDLLDRSKASQNRTMPLQLSQVVHSATPTTHTRLSLTTPLLGSSDTSDDIRYFSAFAQTRREIPGYSSYLFPETASNAAFNDRHDNALSRSQPETHTESRIRTQAGPSISQISASWRQKYQDTNGSFRKSKEICFEEHQKPSRSRSVTSKKSQTTHAPYVYSIHSEVPSQNAALVEKVQRVAQRARTTLTSGISVSSTTLSPLSHFSGTNTDTSTTHQLFGPPNPVLYMPKDRFGKKQYIGASLGTGDLLKVHKIKSNSTGISAESKALREKRAKVKARSLGCCQCEVAHRNASKAKET